MVYKKGIEMPAATEIGNRISVQYSTEKELIYPKIILCVRRALFVHSSWY